MTAVLSPFRERFIDYVMDLMNVPYLWGGKDSSGLDCSGLVTFALFIASKTQLDWRRSYNTDVMWRKFHPITERELKPGDLALYAREGNAPGDLDHVMVILSPELCVGACGGDSRTTSPAIAKQQDARVKAKFFYRYRRSEIRGLRRLPEVP